MTMRIAAVSIAVGLCAALTFAQGDAPGGGGPARSGAILVG